MTPDDDAVAAIAARLQTVDGVLGVVLGGSRGRGEARAGSDTDLGLYYRGAIDTDGLGVLARDLAGPDAEVTPHGGWGPWVDGGGWLTVDGGAVDLLYRDLDRVDACWDRVSAGELEFHTQTGHPLGVPDLAYPGELATATVLVDPTGALTERRARFQAYPPALRDAVVDRLWEASFLVGGVAKAAPRGDTAYVALCLSRVLLLAAHALCAVHGRWVTNEKGLVAIAAAQPGAPEGFAVEVDAALGLVATDAPAAVARAGALVEAVRAVCERPA